VHTLICGTTLSGKTTLAKKLCASLSKSGHKCVVLTPLGDKWEADLVTDDPSIFMDAFVNNTDMFCFMDEAKETVGRYNEEMAMTANRGRHWGHSCFYIPQRVQAVATDVRGQCHQLFCFAVGVGDSKVLAEEWNNPELLKAPDLNQGEYIRVMRFGKDRKKFAERGRVF